MTPIVLTSSPSSVLPAGNVVPLHIASGSGAVPFTKSATRKAAAAPALAYLNGDKVPIGDFLALLVGKNEFM